MTNQEYNQRLDKILESVFMAGLGIAGADDISPEDKDTAILNTQRYFVDEAKQAITLLIKELVVEAKPKEHIDVYTYTNAKTNGDIRKIALDQFEQNLLKALEEK